MNFHKTIGFLASLLLVLGIGVPDSFAQDDPTIAVTVRPVRITEGQTRSVTVSVKLSADAPSGGVTVSVALPGTFPAGSNLAATHDVEGTATAGFPNIEIAEGERDGMSIATVTAAEDSDTDVTNDTNYNHPRDKDVELAVTATGHQDATATLQVRDDDQPRGAITLTAAPLGINVGGSESVTLTATLPAAPGGTNTVSVSFTTAHSNGNDGEGGAATGVDIIGTDKMATSTLSGMTVTAAGSITVTANAVGYTPGMVTIHIIDRNAMDVEGFRVTIESHADGAWVGAGAKKVKVQVRRLNRFAYDWTNFESLSVALRDTTTGSNAIYTLSVSGMAMVDENLVFSKGTPAGQGATASNTAIAYSKATDSFIFDFYLQAINASNTATDIFGADIANGRRLGVHAVATFGTSADPDPTLSSNDAKNKVYASPSALATVPAADQTVGDGKLIKIDLLAPTNIAVDNLVVTRKDKTLTADTELKIGDEIKIKVNVDAQSRFRDGGVVIQVRSQEVAAQNTGTVVGKINRTLHTAAFSQVDVINAAGKALETTWRLTEGLIKLQANAKSKTRDGANINANALFEPDNAGITIRAGTRDQAGNVSYSSASLALIADTRKPVIDVLHPADGGYFAGAIGDTDTGFDQFLKPLKIRVDEPINSMDVYVHKDQKIMMWSDESREFDRSLSVGDAVNSVGDTIVYDTQGLKLDAKGEKTSAAGGSKINLVIEVTDKVGNKTTKTLSGVFHDEQAPMITDFFPKTDLLDGNVINDATRHPVITLPESVDSIAVVYDGSSGDDIVETVSGVTAKGDVDVPITTAFVQDRTYTLTIFARDLAGNASESDPTLAADMTFNAQFDNPKANAFTVMNMTGNTDPTKASAGVIAGQAFTLEIQAIDNSDTPADTDDRDAVTYKNVDADGNMASEVRISAWNMNGGAASSVRFSGTGVDDNGDGSATLDAAGWSLGKRTVHAESEMVIDATKILVEHLNAGDGGTSVAVFDGAIEGLYVDAADFAGFELTAWEEGVEGAVEEVWGDFVLRVVPVDDYGNPSLKAYMDDPSSVADSLNLLDKNAKKENILYDEVDVTFRSNPALDDLPSLFEWPIPQAGDTFDLVAPDDKKRVSIQVRVVNESLDDDDMRSQDIKTTESFDIRPPLMPVLTLWVPEVDGDQAGNDVVIPADPGNITVTVRAEGFKAGSMVTFTKNGTMMDPVTADGDGNAPLMITMGEAGSVMVSATDGQYSTDELTVVFTDMPSEPMRMAHEDANGDPVYLVYDQEAGPSDYTVDSNDLMAFIASYGSMADDDNYNLQADTNDDGAINEADLLNLLASWGKTDADAPASKPIVLLPGVNENAEFSLSLGSARVVAGELVAVDVSLANVQAVMGYGFALNYEVDKFEFISVAPADEDLLTSTGGETLFHHIVADGQIEVATGMYNGTAVSGGGDVVRFVFRVLREFEDNARFEIANGVVFDPSQLQNPVVVAGVLELQSTPREFALHQNFPNPFNPDTTIKYDLAESADVTLQIYNVLGQVVRTLVASEVQNAGRYQIRWNGMDDRGVPVSSGVYFYRISAGEFQNVQKLMLLK